MRAKFTVVIIIKIKKDVLGKPWKNMQTKHILISCSKKRAYKRENSNYSAICKYIFKPSRKYIDKDYIVCTNSCGDGELTIEVTRA